MPVKIRAEGLSAALAAVDGAVECGLEVPIFECFCFDGDNVFAWNDRVGIRTGLGEDAPGGRFGMPQGPFQGIVSSLSGEITMEVKDGQAVVKQGARGKWVFPTQPPDGFAPVWSDKGPGPGPKDLTIDGGDGQFAAEIRSLLPVIAKDGRRATLDGIQITPGMACGSDSVRVQANGLRKGTVKNFPKGAPMVVLPLPLAKALADMGDATGTIWLDSSGKVPMWRALWKAADGRESLLAAREVRLPKDLPTPIAKAVAAFAKGAGDEHPIPEGMAEGVGRVVAAGAAWAATCLISGDGKHLRIAQSSRGVGAGEERFPSKLDMALRDIQNSHLEWLVKSADSLAYSPSAESGVNKDVIMGRRGNVSMFVALLDPSEAAPPAPEPEDGGDDD